MNQKPSNIVCIACSIFRHELEALKDRGDLNLTIRYLDSMLHMDPAKLHLLLDSLLQSELKKGRQVLLLYGDCHAYMREQETMSGVERIRGINCPDILLGHDKYRFLRKQGAFILLPEWTLRWREIFQGELGLNEEVAKDFFAEMHTKLLYLDTGRMPIPIEQLRELSDYTGLSYEIMPIGPDHMLTTILKAIVKMERDED